MTMTGRRHRSNSTASQLHKRPPFPELSPNPALGPPHGVTGLLHGRRHRSNSMPVHSTSHHPVPHHPHRLRDRSNSHHARKPQTKSSLWKGAVRLVLDDGAVVQMVGMDSRNHTIYARVEPVDPTAPAPVPVVAAPATGTDASPSPPAARPAVPLIRVVEAAADEGRRRVLKAGLARGAPVAADSCPAAAELLRLGAVWLVNETAYAAEGNARARRLGPGDSEATPDWRDMTLRVHVHPDRFFPAHEVDWGRYHRGLLLDDGTRAVVGGKVQRVPVAGFPDQKDGVLVYEDEDLGFAVLDKPGGVPCHSTLSNHAEDVVSLFGAARAARQGAGDHRAFLSVPLHVEPETAGLVLAATRKEFCAHMATRLAAGGKPSAAAPQDKGGAPKAAPPAAGADAGDGGKPPVAQVSGLAKTYRCLVCIKAPDDIDRIEKMVNRSIEHYVDVKSATPKKFVRNKPKSPHPNSEWARCELKITSTGQSANYRAACVSSTYSDSNDFTLAHRLWDPRKEHPAEDVGALYVMQLDVRLLTRSPHQIRGQLAALGVPIVGDGPYGGGVCEMRRHRHVWTRMAVQICHLEFARPQWEETAAGAEGEKAKRELVSSTEEKCVFHLNTAWWTEYLVDYEKSLGSDADP